jgi:hypothetical protein
MNKIEIEIPDGKVAKWVNGVLTLVDDDVRVRIKTFEDACAELGENHQYVRAYREWMHISYAECEDITAYMKLRIICEALNEGWVPTFNDGEYRYYPWFCVYIKEEYDKFDEEDKTHCVPLRSSHNASANGGLVFANANSAGSGSYSSYGVRLAFKTPELAEYCGKQFADIWFDFLFR